MNDIDAETEANALVMDFELEARPEKVWRAISIPAYREAWLPGRSLADDEATVVAPGRKIQYTLRDSDPPFLDSVVTFEVHPHGEDGARLRIVHALPRTTSRRATMAVNDNRSPTRLAA